MFSSVEIRHLHAVIALAEDLNFTRAAQRLRIAQPALTARGASLDSSKEKEVRNPQAKSIKYGYGDEQAEQRGAARGDLDRAHRVGESTGTSVL
ncbi:MAG: LysR family transcriptional regulator [Candidatus Acidiferrales bacterium]